MAVSRRAFSFFGSNLMPLLPCFEALLPESSVCEERYKSVTLNRELYDIVK